MSKLYFRYGAMNSGKTTLLLQVAHNYEERGFKVLVLKPIIDTKGEDEIVSRIGISRKVDYLIEKDFLISNLNLENIACILVDESQFLTDTQVMDLWKITKEKNIPVICYGLKIMFNSKMFPGSKRLMELSDCLEEIITICKCGKRAKFNVRYVNDKLEKEGSEVVIDGTKNVRYESLCGVCFNKEFYKE